MNQMTVFWVVAAVVLGVIEASSINLITIWFAISALISALIAALGGSTHLQCAAFVVFAALLVALTRPLAKRILSKRIVATNADRIISAFGVVTKRIDTIENEGQVKVMGQVWSAKSKDGEALEEGTPVTVEALEGVKVVVSPKK